MFVASIVLSVVSGFVYYFAVRPEVYVFLSFAVIIPLVLWLPRLLVYSRGHVREPWLQATDVLGFLLVVLNAPGTLFFHSLFPEFQYDRFLHFGAAYVSVILGVYIWVGITGHVRHRDAVLVIVLVAAGMFIWEFFQWTQDKIFHTHMFYDYAQSISWDLSEDLIFGALGIAAAAPLAFSLLPAIRRLEK